MKENYICTCYKNPETGETKSLVEEYELGAPAYKELFTGYNVIDMRIVTKRAINDVLDMFYKTYNPAYIK